MSTSYHELWYGGARYRLVYVWQAEPLGGRRLSGNAAERVLAALLRSGDGRPVRNAYRDFADASEPSRASNEQILRWFSAALGGELGGVGTVRLVLIQLHASAPVLSPRLVARGGAAGETRSAAPSSTPSQLRRAAAPARETSWVELRFVDDGGQPLAAQAFSITLADGSTRQGTLDDSGSVYLGGIPPGSCSVEFPGFSARVLS